MPLCTSVNRSSCGNSTPSTSRRRDVASARRIAATLLAATASIATLPHAAAAPCGEQVLAQSFDKYKGGYRAWTAEMAEADFDVGSTNRDSAAGESLEPGILSWSRGYENVQVGEGNMRVDFPEGVPNLHWSAADCCLRTAHRLLSFDPAKARVDACKTCSDLCWTHELNPTGRQVCMYVSAAAQAALAAASAACYSRCACRSP